MRYPEDHKAQVRADIVEKAARALRREGLSGVSIPTLMKEAGLTHGTFYNHFASRDVLVAEAVRAAADATGAAILSKDAGDLMATLAAYLSVDHAHHPEGGCVLAALGTEGPRQAPLVREAFAYAARGFVDLIAQKLKPDAPPDEALRLSAQMIGAVVLARLVDDPDLAARVLDAAQKHPA